MLRFANDAVLFSIKINLPVTTEKIQKKTKSKTKFSKPSKQFPGQTRDRYLEETFKYRRTTYGERTLEPRLQVTEITFKTKDGAVKPHLTTTHTKL